MTAHLLIVDDDDASATYMQRMLTRQQLHVTHTPTARGARRVLDQQPTDLVLLDVALPDASGFEVAEWLRQTHADVGIMFVTGHAGMADRLHAFDAGADDYVCKPILSAEFVARVGTLLRRRGSAAPMPLLSAGGVSLDRARHLVTLPDGHALTLDPPAAQVLATLLARPNRLIPLHDLAQGLGTSAAAAEHWAVRLRDAIEPDPVWARYVQVIRNVGARFLLPRR
jgi:two-component system, OmpR family, KDP operon response regulator KdpE